MKTLLRTDLTVKDISEGFVYNEYEGKGNRGKDATEMVASLTEDYGKVPDPIMHATLELVDASYQHRSPADAQQMYYVLYGFDFKVKPYMKL